MHGSSNGRGVSDLDIVGPSAIVPPVKLISWRVDLEQQVLESNDILDVMVMRPAQLYGRESPDWSHFVLPILEAVQIDMGATERGNGDGGQSTIDHIKIPLDPDSKPALIHVDDTASAFMKAVEKLPIISGTGVYPVFDLATSQKSMSAIIAGFATAWGYKGKVELVGSGEDQYAEAMSASMRSSASRARQILGWWPSRLNGFVQDIDIYAAALAAAQ